MSRFRFLTLGAALAAALFAGSAVQAANVSYIALGEFTFDNGGGPITNSTYTNGAGATIAYTASPFFDLSTFPSNVNYGTFDTTGTTVLGPVNATFRLTVLQGDPEGDVLIFDGFLTGDLGPDGSTTAYVQFTTLTQISHTSAGLVTYAIVNGSDGFLGRVNINPPSAGATSTIEGRVNFAVPEPATVLMLGLAAPVGLFYGLRRRHAA